MLWVNLKFLTGLTGASLIRKEEPKKDGKEEEDKPKKALDGEVVITLEEDKDSTSSLLSSPEPKDPAINQMINNMANILSHLWLNCW